MCYICPTFVTGMSKVFQIGGQSRVVAGCAERLLPKLLASAGRVVVITDREAERAAGQRIAPWPRLRIGQGEGIKNLKTVAALYDGLLELGADRETFILGVGGGIVTDVAGFTASTWMRGVRFGFVPTTLLAQVDASVGGKNGVNVGGFKNMAGTFTQPEFVILDASLLDTLPDREFRAGLAEAIKAAVIGDPQLFELLEGTDFETLRRDPALTEAVVARAVAVKAAIVGRDEREAGERRLLNLGHTVAHALERCTPARTHGEAVAIGLAAVARAAVQVTGLRAAEADRIVALLVRYGFDLTPPVGREALAEAMRHDKKAAADTLHAVYPTAIGRCTVRRMPLSEFESSLVF